MNPHFDLMLAYPQWQGSGRSRNLPRGAAAAAAVCERFAPRVDVPLSDATGDDHGIVRWNALFEQFTAARALLDLHAPERILTAGGDCAVDIAVIDHLAARYPDLHIVWIDAHRDANTPVTSPSGNLHGMPVSAIMGHAAEPMRRLLRAPIRPDRFSYCYVRVGDQGEVDFGREQGLTTLDDDGLAGQRVHIHFDLDALDPAEFPHLAYQETGGPTVADALALVGSIAAANDVVGLSITEFAPVDDVAAEAGSAVIAQICEAVLQ